MATIDYRDVKLSLAVMYHKSREWMADRLIEKVGDFPITRVCDDREEPGVLGLWPTAKRAWSSIASGATHHCVLQEDVLPCRNFVPALLRAIYVNPTNLIGLYCRSKFAYEAFARGDSWVVIRAGVWGQGSVFPVGDLETFFAWEKKHVKSDFVYDDTRLAMYSKFAGRPVWCAIPSLVEHAAASDSLLGHNNKNRVATVFAGVNFDGLLIDWSVGLEKPLKTTASIKTTHLASYSEEGFVE